MMKNAKTKYPVQTPQSKEEYYYRQIFESFFSCPSAALTVPVGPTIACSTPTAFRWSEEFKKMADPSGRSVKLHEHAIQT
jgi:asparagine synthase (glutamine-hydrolysing)